MNNTLSHTEDARQACAPGGDSDETARFSYTYSAQHQKEVESIRLKYLPAEENKLEQLHRLDKQAERRGTIVSIALGTVSALLLGIGMVLTMVYTRFFILGIIIGLIGLAGAALAYPLCLRITRKERVRIAPEILRLSDELMNGAK